MRTLRHPSWEYKGAAIPADAVEESISAEGMMMSQQEKIDRFVRILLAWSRSNLRDFPWRKTKDPYRILIAEIMLQRTKAEQVVPVYGRFVEKYPDASSVARASPSELLEEIRSLGLEKRALGLKKLAEQLVEKHEGKIPCSKDELLKLHWVGNYIANAVLCHAFGVKAPTVDANFARVLTRVFSLELKHPAQKDKKAWAFAQALMPSARGHARELNLAILDLAATICLPKKPLCGICPLCSTCEYARGSSVHA